MASGDANPIKTCYNYHKLYTGLILVRLCYAVFSKSYFRMSDMRHDNLVHSLY